jgi:hypothetical protein
MLRLRIKLSIFRGPTWQHGSQTHSGYGENLQLRHRDERGSGTHPAPCALGTTASMPGGIKWYNESSLSCAANNNEWICTSMSYASVALCLTNHMNKDRVLADQLQSVQINGIYLHQPYFNIPVTQWQWGISQACDGTHPRRCLLFRIFKQWGIWCRLLGGTRCCLGYDQLSPRTTRLDI